MSAPILSTKLYVPPRRPKAVLRPRLVERLNEGMQRKLTLISASAGYGKTTLVSEWLAGCSQPVAWLSLDEGDNDPACFLTYLCAALQTMGTSIGEGLSGALRSPQPPRAESIITALLSEITTAVPDPFVLVLDDYHVIDARPIDHAIAYLLERMPPQMHLVITTREEPRLPLARLRVRDQLMEMRASDLRFTFSEAADFLGGVMGLSLSTESIALLETRTEGWVAGLQLAALSMQQHQDRDSFVHSFTGSHPHVLDYVAQEVLERQSASTRNFLLRTSILDRLCGTLCDAVLGRGAGENIAPLSSGQETLEYLEHANLFVVPLDSERRWYRYHHLFADLLRKKLHQSVASNIGDDERDVAELHLRASIWYENNGFAIEAFRHAASAKDTDRAARLAEGEGMPLIFRGAVTPVLNWLDSMPNVELDARPSLWVMYASALLMLGQTSDVELKLQAAERALLGTVEDVKTRDLIGHIASMRATLAVSKHEAETIMVESRRALEYLHPDNLPVRTATTWTLGYAYQLQGNRAAAGKSYAEALSISQRIGHVIISIMSALGLGNLQEADNQLVMAAETYHGVMKMAGDPPLPVACEAYLGLARICYEWNDLDAAMQHGYVSVQLANQIDHTDRVIAGEVFLAKLKLARGEVSDAAAMLSKADHIARRQTFVNQLPHIAVAQVLVLLHQGNFTAAAQLAQKHELPVSQARVHLAQGDTSAALAVLEPLRSQAEARGWEDERLKIMLLQAIALHAHGDQVKAMQHMRDALTMAEPGGFVRTFLDEGIPMSRLLHEAASYGMMPNYLSKLKAEFEAGIPEQNLNSDQRHAPAARSLIEPLSGRELEILRLIAQGLSNREISERLFIALPTVKGHNRIIFDKLQVKRRTEAVAKARQLELL